MSFFIILLILLNVLGFRTNDSCISQPIIITPSTFSAFEANPSWKVRGDVLDLSKAFGKEWHGLLNKLKNNRMYGSLLRLFKSHLHKSNQCVVLNGQSEIWKPIKSGILQCSVLDHLLILVFINDLPKGQKPDVKLFTEVFNK